MQVTEDELWDRLETALDQEPSESRLEEVREIVRHAEAADYLDLLVESRLRLIQVRFEWAPEREAWPDMLAAYTRCVALYTSMPERFDEDQLDLLWQGLTIVGVVMVHLADRPASRIRAILDDMQPRCRADRDDLHLIYMLRMMLEARVGNIAAADAALRRVQTMAPPEFLNPGTATLEQVRYLADLGRDEEAVEAAGPLLSGLIPFDDGEGGEHADPRERLSCLLLPFLRTGRLDAARDIYRRTHRHLEEELDLAAHLEFCALSGNEKRGREIFLTLEDTDEPADMYSEMRVNAAAALLCGRLVELGRGEETSILQPPSDRPDGEPRELTFAQHYAECVEDAMQFARRLDECNGTTYQSERVHALIHAEPIVRQLPLTMTDRALGRLRRTPPPAPVAPEPPADPAALLDEAERAHQLLDRDRARAVLDRLDAASTAPLHGAAAALRAEVRAVTADDTPQRETELARAAELYRQLGHEDRAQMCLGRLGMWRCASGRTEEGLPQVTAALATLRECGDRYQVASAHVWQGHAHRTVGRFDDALAAYAAAEALVAEGGEDPARAAMLRGAAGLHRGDLLLALAGAPDKDETGILNAATKAADAALAALIEAGRPSVTGDAHHLRGRIAHRAGDLDAASHAYAEAAAAADSGGATAATARAMRGELLMASGAADEAILELVEAVAAFTALGDSRGAYARVELANAYRTFDRWLDVAECAEEAIPELDKSPEAADEAKRARWLLLQAYEGLRHAGAALRVLGELLDRETSDAAIGMLHRTAGTILSAVDQDSEAAERFQEAAEAYGRAAEPLNEAYCRRHVAKTLHWAGQNDQAMALRDEVQTLMDRLPDSPENAEDTAIERACWTHDSAMVLAGAGRYGEAAERAVTAATAYRTLDLPRAAGTAEMLAGRAFDDAGRRDLALAAARRALDDLPEGLPERASAADLLADLTGSPDDPEITRGP